MILTFYSLYILRFAVGKYMEVSQAVVERQCGNILGSQPVKRIIRNLLVLLYAAGGSAAFAQSAQIPQELLELDNQRCFQGCKPNASEAACKILCDCAVGEYKKRLDIDAYLKLTAQMSREEVTLENRQLLDNIAQMCVEKIREAGVDVDKPTDPSPENTKP